MVRRISVSIAIALALVFWARAAEHNVGLPVYGGPLAGWMFAASGTALATVGVTGRLAAWVPHAFFAGAVLMCFGASMAIRSAAGLWLVTPVVALGCAAWVLGHRRWVPARIPTLHVLPPPDDKHPSTRERVVFWMAGVIPWLALYGFTVNMRLPGTAFRFPFEQDLPIWSWTSILYQTSYITVALAPWCTRTRRELRELTITVWIASAVVFPFYWIVPSEAPRRPLTADNPAADLLHWERQTYPPTAAFPSFHVLWAIFVARLYRPRWLGHAYIAAIAISCITTGMHYIPDVLASLLIAPLFLRPQEVWRWMQRWASVGRELSFGLVIAVVIHLVVVVFAAGMGNERTALITTAVGVACLVAFRKWNYVFFATLVSVALTCTLFETRWTLAAAHALAAPWTYAAATLRPASGLASMLLGGTLARMWISGSTHALITGSYMIGAALILFVEEGFTLASGPRPNLTQWLAVALFVTGAVVTSL